MRTLESPTGIPVNATVTLGRGDIRALTEDVTTLRVGLRARVEGDPVALDLIARATLVHADGLLTVEVPDPPDVMERNTRGPVRQVAVNYGNSVSYQSGRDLHIGGEHVTGATDSTSDEEGIVDVVLLIPTHSVVTVHVKRGEVVVDGHVFGAVVQVGQGNATVTRADYATVKTGHGNAVVNRAVLGTNIHAGQGDVTVLACNGNAVISVGQGDVTIEPAHGHSLIAAKTGKGNVVIRPHGGAIGRADIRVGMGNVDMHDTPPAFVVNTKIGAGRTRHL